MGKTSQLTISVKIYKVRKEVMVAACDAELLGNEYCTGNIQIKVGDFYRGKLVSEGDFAEMLSEMTTGNFVGERTIRICISLGIIDKRDIIDVGGVKHAQYISI